MIPVTKTNKAKTIPKICIELGVVNLALRVILLDSIYFFFENSLPQASDL